MIYKRILRPLLFCLDSERIHHWVLRTAKLLRIPILKNISARLFEYSDRSLESEIFGVHFSNPILLAAGFDKECEAYDLFSAIGFGGIEFGTITAQPQPGNPRPRIFRLPRDYALINRMGFPSAGVDVVVQRLRTLPRRNEETRIGVNIGKTKLVSIDDAESDYGATLSKVMGCCDYVAINVSSPNTPELRKLQERSRLEALLRALQLVNTSQTPLLLKIAPDLSLHEIDEILEVCKGGAIAGIIATNTTFSRDGLIESSEESGGLSGRPLFERSRAIVHHIYRVTNGALPIVGVGGISTVEQVIAMIESGASLVQIYTGLIYEGPFLVKSLKRELAHYLHSQKLSSIKSLVGIAHTR